MNICDLVPKVSYSLFTLYPHFNPLCSSIKFETCTRRSKNQLRVLFCSNWQFLKSTPYTVSVFKITNFIHKISSSLATKFFQQFLNCSQLLRKKIKIKNNILNNNLRIHFIRENFSKQAKNILSKTKIIPYE